MTTALVVVSEIGADLGRNACDEHFTVTGRRGQAPQHVVGADGHVGAGHGADDAAERAVPAHRRVAAPHQLVDQRDLADTPGPPAMMTWRMGCAPRGAQAAASGLTSCSTGSRGPHSVGNTSSGW